MGLIPDLLLPPAIPILIGAALAGFVQGLSGFGLGLVVTVFWSGLLPPVMAAPLIAISSVGGQALSIRHVLPSLELRRALPMVGAGLLGILPGAALLPYLEAGHFRLGVGLLLCVFCPAMLLLHRLPRVTWGGRGADAAAGLLGGVMGGVAGLSGPAPILWCALRGWERDRQRAMIQTFVIAMQGAGLAAYAATGLITAEVLRLALWVVPCVMLPSVLGTRLYGRLGGDGFRRVVLAVLAASGVALVVRAALGR